MQHKTRLCLIMGLSVLLLITQISLTSAYDLDKTFAIKSGEYFQTYVYLEKGTTEKTFFFKSNSSVDIYVLNETAMGTFLTTKTLPAIPSYSNITNFDESLSFDQLLVQYNLYNKTDVKGNQYLDLYFVIMNLGVNQANGLIRVNYAPLENFLNDMRAFSANAAIFAFIIVGLLLIRKAVELQKENDLNKASILRGFGMGYLLAGTVFGMGDIRNYWNNEIGGLPNLYRVYISIAPFPIDYYDLYIASILLLGSGVFMFMCYIVEKNVKVRTPFVSVNLIISGFLTLGIFVVPFMAFYFFIYFAISVILDILTVVYVYIQLISQNTGIIRKNALLVLLGMLLPTIALLYRMFGYPQGIQYIIADLTILLGLYLFYKGNLFKNE